MKIFTGTEANLTCLLEDSTYKVRVAPVTCVDVIGLYTALKNVKTHKSIPSLCDQQAFVPTSKCLLSLSVSLFTIHPGNKRCPTSGLSFENVYRILLTPCCQFWIFMGVSWTLRLYPKIIYIK